MKVMLPFVPSLPERIETIFNLVQVLPNQRVVDLGAGDGRLVIAFAQARAEAHGFEIQPKLVKQAHKNIQKAGLENCAFVYHQDFWLQDLSKFEIVTIYGMAAIMARLAIKLTQELKPGTVVISNGFPLPGWDVWKNKDFIYVYIKK